MKVTGLASLRSLPEPLSIRFRAVVVLEVGSGILRVQLTGRM